MAALFVLLLLGIPAYFLPLLIAWARGLSGLSLALIAAGLLFMPVAGWFAGLYFSLADTPDAA